jgi:hypothetical protein
MTAESPFIEGTNIQYAWDSTTLGDLKTCLQYYYLQRIQGWQPKEESVHLRFGRLYQEALVNYTVSVIEGGLKHEDAVHDAVGVLLRDSLNWWDDADLKDMRGSAKGKTRFNLVQLAIWHMEHYRDDPMKTHILSDGKAAVELSFTFELDWAPGSGDRNYVLCGHLDEVKEFAGELYVLDNKTTGFPLSSYFFDQYDPENQMTLYTLAGQVLMDAPVKGVIIDAAMVKELEKETKIEFQRGMTFRTKDNIDEWVDELRYWFDLQERAAIADRWPHNDKACGMYGGCRFREVCSKSPLVRERFLKAAFVQVPVEERWNPLKPRTRSTLKSSASPKKNTQSAAE